MATQSEVKSTVQCSVQSHLNAIQELESHHINLVVTAAGLIARCEGKVIVSGVGKSGYAARLLASLFCSMDVPAIFLSPTEAVHGELGVIRKEDVIIGISNSGRTRDLLHVLQYGSNLGAESIAIFGANTGCDIASVVLDVSVDSDDDLFAPLPTTSTAMVIVIGHALACAVASLTDFDVDRYREIHPGGHIGRLLNSKQDQDAG